MHFPGQQQAKYTNEEAFWGRNISEGDQEKYLSLAISEKELIRRRNAWLEFISHPIPTERRFTTTLLLIFLKKNH
uniref:Uncharacterized protein n=1 Tax=Populus trichocarpa TaxID=3694 RepID=A0A2K2CAC6_POPTR